MTRFNDLSIRKKLIAMIVLISTAILIISSAIVISNEIMTSKKQLIERSMVEARFIGEYCIVYLSFNDSTGAANILKNVESIPTILAVRVYDDKNKLFSEFKKPDQEIHASELKTEVFSEFAKDHLHIFHPIFFENKFYGTVFLKVSTRALRTTLIHFVLSMLGLVIILTVLSYFVAAKLQNIISRPILDLARATVEISKEADYSFRVHKQSNNEIGVLFEGFNAMLEQIEIRQKERDRAEKELKEYRDHLEQLVAKRTADLKKSEEILKKRSVELEAANKELEAFSYSVSHDLRAPLRGIDGWSLALLEDYGDQLDEQGRTFLGRVRTETQRMGALVDELLKLSHLNRTEICRQQVDLSGIVHALAARLQESAADRAVEFIIQPGLIIQGDAQLLEVALSNLLENAFKFTGRCTQARIEFGRSVGSLAAIFFVRDNGVGFDMAYANKLFGAFQRMHKTSDFPGTGIGLATVQRIMRRHGGRVWAEAEVDRGATFYFTLEGNA